MELSRNETKKIKIKITKYSASNDYVSKGKLGEKGRGKDATFRDYTK